MKIYSHIGQAPKGKELIVFFSETYGKLPALLDEMNQAGL
jgi:hypothetical protein